jgi:hypothetical protein
MSLLLLCACVETVAAQTQTYYPFEDVHRQWETAGFAGVSTIEEHSFLTPIDGGALGFQNVGLRYASGYQIGWRINENLGDFWNSNLEVSFANQPLTFTNLSPSVPSLSLSHSVTHFTYAMSYLPRARDKRFRPYASIGTGAALFYITSSSKEFALQQGVPLRDNWNFVGLFGGGFKYLTADHVAVSFDVRDNLTSFPTYGLSPTATVVNGQLLPGFNPRGTMQNWQLNFGIAYQWDREW